MRVWLFGCCLAAAGAACGSSSSNAPDAGKGVDAAKAIDAPRAIDANLNAPTDTPVVPCEGTMTQIYAATPQTGAALGAILACAPDTTLDAATAGTMAKVTATSAVKEYRIAYQTRDGAGGPAVSTARVYLPSTPRARPVPIVVAMHGSVGLADSCAPSLDVDINLPLPYAARGFAAIAPDLSGLGNAGTQDYLNNTAQAYQTLDGARALRALLSPGITADEVVLTGYSQGGGAVLSARALWPNDGAGVGTLTANVVYAPEWPIRLGSFDYIGILRDPTQLTIATGLSFSSVAVLRQYAYFANHTTSGEGGNAMPSQFRVGIESAVQSDCLVPLGAYIQLTMLHTGDLIDDTLRRGVLACVDALGPAAGCTGDAAGYYNSLIADQLTIDNRGGPVLIVQGLLDLIMPPASEASCVHDKLVSSGVDVDTCVFPSADHSNIMDQHGSGVAWAESVLAGGPRAECDQSNQLPSCSE